MNELETLGKKIVELKTEYYNTIREHREINKKRIQLWQKIHKLEGDIFKTIAEIQAVLSK